MPPIDKNIEPKDFPAYLAARRDLKRIERSNAGKVLRRFANGIAPSGYRRKSTYFSREFGHLIQFLHVHKFSFGPQFRIHVCLRVLNEPQSFVALQGIESGDFADYRSLSFEDSESSIIRCAERMDRRREGAAASRLGLLCAINWPRRLNRSAVRCLPE
jgi:hypothetical protein